MSDIPPEKQAATTTSVSNKEYSTYLPLPIIETGPGVFTNPFTDEVEAASMSGFFTNETNLDDPDLGNTTSTSYITYAPISQNQIEANNNKVTLQHQQNYQQQQHDSVPVVPLHFQAHDRTSKVTQLNASSFILGEIPTLNSIPMIENEKNRLSEILQNKEALPTHGSTETQNRSTQDRVQTLNQVNEQGKYHTQRHSNLSSETYRSHIIQGNQPCVEKSGNSKAPGVTSSSQVTSTLHIDKNLYSTKGISSQINTTPQTTLSFQKHSKRKSTAVSVSSSSIPPDMSEDEEEMKRRKKRDRNLREQQRSHRITEQITELKRVLVDTANIKFKKTDKHSILCKAVEHIRDLQSRCVSLDTEHQKLVSTISQTSELVHSSSGINSTILKQESNAVRPLEVTSSGRNPTFVDSSQFSNGHSTSRRYIPEASTSAFFNTLVFDYKTIFGQCVVALAVFGLDGLIIDFNNAFNSYFAVNNDQKALVVKNETSLFHLVNDPKEVSQLCGAMGVMIKNKSSEPLFWGSKLNSIVNQSQPVIMNLTLGRNSEGKPHFFNCSIVS